MNLYVHFPFCRQKCSYCVLYSRVGTTAADRAAYVAMIRRGLEGLDKLENLDPLEKLETVYFGGGSPALCDLKPLSSIRYQLSTNAEFTIELHPLDVTEDKLLELEDLGVNRISMGVQSLDDAVLAHMGRGYTALQAAHAFAQIKRHFDNAGIDLIVGYPKEGNKRTTTSGDNVTDARKDANTLHQLGSWGLTHCSVYALQNERRLANVPDDETTLNELAQVGAFLGTLGLKRYEISNYALPGCECRHNRAVWRGEDYIGLGDGAAGRVGLKRTLNFGGRNPKVETVTSERDEVERTIFRLRTNEGLDATRHAEWCETLRHFVDEGLLRELAGVFYLTQRGTEVCDTILAELV